MKKYIQKFTPPEQMSETATAGGAIPAEDVERRLRKCLILFTEKYYPDLAKMLTKCAEKLEQSKEDLMEPEIIQENLTEKPEPETEKESQGSPIQPELDKEDLMPKPPIKGTSNIPSNFSKNEHLKNCLLDLAKKYHPDLAKCISKCVEENDQAQPLPKPEATLEKPVDSIVMPPILTPAPKPTPDPAKGKQMNGCLDRVAELYHPKLPICLQSCDPSTATGPCIEGSSEGQQLQTCLTHLANKYHPDLAKCIEKYADKIEQSQAATEPIQHENSEEKFPVTPVNPPTEPLPSPPESTDDNLEQDLKVCLVQFAEKCHPDFDNCINKCAKKLEQSQEPTIATESTALSPASAQPTDAFPKPIEKEVSTQKESEFQNRFPEFAENYHPDLAEYISKYVEKLETRQVEPAQPPIQPSEPTRHIPIAENAKKDVQFQNCLLRFTEKYHPELATCIAKCAGKLRQFSNEQVSPVQPPVESSDKDLYLCLLTFADQYHPELDKCLRACVEKMDQGQTKKAPAAPVDQQESGEEKKLLQDFLLQLTKLHQPELAKLIEEGLANGNNPIDDQNPPIVEDKHEIEEEKEPPQRCLIQKDLNEQQQTDTKLVGTVSKEPPKDSEPFATEGITESSKESLKHALTETNDPSALDPIKESLERIAEDLYPDLTLSMGQCVALGEDSNVELASPESTTHKMRIYLDDMENLAKVSVLPTDSQETRKEEVIIETPMSAIAKASELSPVDVEFIMERQSGATSAEAEKRDLLNSMVVILKHIWPELMESLRREMMEETSDIEKA
ncbi:hypothetical protein ACTXT7_014755 [Hymenolepis weldensis]